MQHRRSKSTGGKPPRVKALSVERWERKLTKRQKFLANEVSEAAPEHWPVLNASSGRPATVSLPLPHPHSSGGGGYSSPDEKPKTSHTPPPRILPPEGSPLKRSMRTVGKPSATRSCLQRAHPKFGFDKVAILSIGDRLNSSEMMAFYTQWVTSYGHEETSFASLSVWAEIILTQTFQASAHLSSPNPLRTSICCFLLSKLSAVFGTFEQVLGSCTREIFNALYYNFLSGGKDPENLRPPPLDGYLELAHLGHPELQPPPFSATIGEQQQQRANKNKVPGAERAEEVVTTLPTIPNPNNSTATGGAGNSSSGGALLPDLLVNRLNDTAALKEGKSKLEENAVEQTSDDSETEQDSEDKMQSPTTPSTINHWDPPPAPDDPWYITCVSYRDLYEEAVYQHAVYKHHHDTTEKALLKHIAKYHRLIHWAELHHTWWVFRSWKNLFRQKEATIKLINVVSSIRSRWTKRCCFQNWQQYNYERQLDKLEELRQKDLQEQSEEMNTYIAKLREELSQAKWENAHLKEALNQKVVKTTEDSEEVDMLKTQIEELQQKQLLLKNENTHLEEQLNNSNKQIEDLRKVIKSFGETTGKIIADVAGVPDETQHQNATRGFSLQDIASQMDSKKTRKAAQERLVSDFNNLLKKLDMFIQPVEPEYVPPTPGSAADDDTKKPKNDFADVVVPTQHPYALLFGEPAEGLLFRWFTKLLRKVSKNTRTVSNFNRDVCDCENFIAIMELLFPEQIDYSQVMKIISPKERAAYIISVARSQGMPHLIDASDIIECKEELNFLFTSWLFERYMNTHSVDYTKIRDREKDWLTALDKKQATPTELVEFYNILYRETNTTSAIWKMVSHYITDSALEAVSRRARSTKLNTLEGAADSKFMADKKEYTKHAIEKAMETTQASSEEWEEVTKLLDLHFFDLKKIYTYYTLKSSSATGTSNILLLSEYIKMMEESKIIPTSTSSKTKEGRTAVEIVFTSTMGSASEASSGGHHGHNNHNGRGLPPSQFVESLIRLVNSMPFQGTYSAQQEKEEPDSIMNSLPKRLGRLLSDLVSKAMATDVDEFKRQVYSPKVQNTLNTHQKVLYRIFSQYTVDSRTTLNVKEFLAVMKDAQFFDDVFTRTLAQSVFIAAQDVEDCEGDAEMSFREFLEAVVGVCAFKNPNPLLPLELRLREFIVKLFSERMKQKWPRLKL